MTILISCETAGAKLPAMLSGQFDLIPESSDAPVDAIGAEIAGELAEYLHAPLLLYPYRCDLIDVTRSLKHRGLIGNAWRNQPQSVIKHLIESVYPDYHDQVAAAIERKLQQYHFVVHLSVRSFAPKWNAKFRRADVGLLYDPGRRDESDLCVDWINELYFSYPNLRVRRNYPRRGTVNGITRAMRERFPAAHYLGIEVWLNRAWTAHRVRLRDEAVRQFADAFCETIGLAQSEAA